MALFTHPEFDGHEEVVFCHDAASGLKAIIAIHNSRRGPALGGCRMWPYADEDEALTDVLRLARGMTYKSSLADLPYGGGKSVIIGDPRRHKSEALLRAMAGFVESLGGRYIIAEDVGITQADAEVMLRQTRYVAGTRAGVCSIALGDQWESLEEELRNRFPSVVVFEGDSPGPLLAELQRRSVSRGRLALKCPDGSYAFLDPGEIRWIDALRNYVRVNLGDRDYVVRQPINEFERRLDARFVRIHRSTIVNSTCVSAIERRKHGDFVVVLDSGERLNVSRGYRSGLDAILLSGGLDALSPAS